MMTTTSTIDYQRLVDALGGTGHVRWLSTLTPRTLPDPVTGELDAVVVCEVCVGSGVYHYGASGPQCATCSGTGRTTRLQQIVRELEGHTTRLVGPWMGVDVRPDYVTPREILWIKRADAEADGVLPVPPPTDRLITLAIWVNTYREWCIANSITTTDLAHILHATRVLLPTARVWPVRLTDRLTVDMIGPIEGRETCGRCRGVGAKIWIDIACGTPCMECGGSGVSYPTGRTRKVSSATGTLICLATVTTDEGTRPLVEICTAANGRGGSRSLPL